MNRRLFWLAAGTQGAAVAVLFLILLLAFPRRFFGDYGYIVGPLAWALAAVVSWRVLRLPPSLIALAAAASGVVAALVGFATVHAVGLIVGVAVFGAACGGYEEDSSSAGSESTA